MANNKHKLLVEIKQAADNMTKKDIRTWRNAWEAAARPDNPNRVALYDVYNDVMVDLHLNGCIRQRTDMVLNKAFKIVAKDGKEKPEITEMFEATWFKKFMELAIESIYYGYSLIQFNDLITNGTTRFDSAELVPRKNVVPEYGVIIKNVYDDPIRQGYNYLEGDLAKWCIGIGEKRNLGLLLKLAPQSISKKKHARLLGCLW